jgi:2-amino-4-hydroxy-6-hydroxymethyldihydropteridine diphosphokinase
MTIAYVGLGANVGDPARQIERALEEIAADEQLTVVAVSTLRRTEPVEYVDQPRFLNGAVAVETALPPAELLQRLLAIERRLGRVRGSGPRFGPRTIDLDLLLYGDRHIEEPGLTVPHPRLHERLFVLEPLHELAPTLALPGIGPLETVLRKLQSG